MKIVVFTAPGCGACPTAKAIGHQAALALAIGYETRDVTQNAKSAMLAGVLSVPTTTLFDGDTVVASVTGVQSKATIVNLFANALA